MGCPNCRIEDVEPHTDLGDCIAELRKRREELERALEEHRRRHRLDLLAEPQQAESGSKKK